MGVLFLQSQITAQERRNVDLATSNTTLRKTAAKLGEEKKELSAKVVKLNSRNEKLEDRNAELVKESSMQSSQVDSLKKELANEKAENVAVKVELESTLNKMKFIVVDAILHAWDELMEEFKKGEHVRVVLSKLNAKQGRRRLWMLGPRSPLIP